MKKGRNTGAKVNEQHQNSRMKSILKGNEQNMGRRQQNRVSIVEVRRAERRTEARGYGPGRGRGEGGGSRRIGTTGGSKKSQ